MFSHILISAMKYKALFLSPMIPSTDLLETTRFFKDMLGFSIVMDNVDALWSTIKDKVGGLKYKEPFDQEYGMREIHICIPHTNALLFIGQKL